MLPLGALVDHPGGRWRRLALHASLGSALVLLATLLAFRNPIPLRREPAAVAEAPWAGDLEAVRDALARGDVSAAERAWFKAYVEARQSRRWEGLVQVADAYLRIGELSGSRPAARAKAREIYLAALFRARQQDALNGVLEATEAFAALGDREVAEHGLRIAEGLAARVADPDARARVETFAIRLVAQYFPAPEAGP